MDAEGQEDFQQQLADTRNQRQEQVRAMNSPEVTDDVREQIRQYAQQHGGNADAMLEWEQHRRDTLPERGWQMNNAIEYMENVEAARARKALCKKIVASVVGVALVGGGLYEGSKYGNFSLNPADYWSHHK